jgi:hypothetical protein
VAHKIVAFVPELPLRGAELGMMERIIPGFPEGRFRKLAEQLQEPRSELSVHLGAKNRSLEVRRETGASEPAEQSRRCEVRPRFETELGG